MKLQDFGGSSFLLTIQNKDPLNWQGVLQWLDTGEKVEFRSTLEMMNLMDEAVHRNAPKTSQTSAPRNWDLEKEKAV
jgi:hypothetical protein